MTMTRMFQDNDFHIEPMTQDDLDEVFQAEQLCFPEDAWSKKMLQESLESMHAYCLVLKIEKHLVAYLISYDLLIEGHLLNIAVIPKYRKKGYGAKLLEYWLKIGKSKDWDYAYLEVRYSNIQAINLYEKYHFQRDGLRKNYYHDGEDALLMTYEFKV